MHALIIEDEVLVALHIEDCLRDHGYVTFDLAATQVQAIEAATARCPDLITSDVNLAQGCSISAVQEICRDRLIPVVFITASDWEVHKRAPGSLVVAKPFTSAALAKAFAAGGATDGYNPTAS
jgi:two-component system, response regulator PdtaR